MPAEKSDNINEILDMLECSHLDIFPMRISVSDNQKYEQCNVFYQRYADGEDFLGKFKHLEEQFHECVQTCWLYGDVYVGIYSAFEILERTGYTKINKKVFHKPLKWMQEIQDKSYQGKLILVDDVKKLKKILYLASRECASVMFYFEKLEMLIYMNGLHALVFSEKEKSEEFIKMIAMSKGLYIWKE